jgi:hypothetical protein
VSAVLAFACVQGQAQQTQQSQSGAQQTPAAAPAPQQPPAPSSGTSSSTSSSSAPAAPSERRFSGGVTLSVLGLSMIPGRTFTNYTNTLLNTQYQTTGASSRIGYGLTVQARVKDRFYLDVSGLVRRIGYQLDTTVSTTTNEVLNGTTYPQVTTATTHEDTRARLIDIPALVRYYGVGKHPGSPRWFLEAGGTYRFTNDIRTIIDTYTSSSTTATCCTTTPTKPKHNSTEGVVVGAGIQFTDEFGIHVVPEFRYTRWVEPTFESLSTNTKLNQIEADLSITF